MIALLVVALLLAYILNPLIVFTNKRTHLSRGVVILVVYLLLAAGFVGGFVALGVASFQQISSLIIEIPVIIPAFAERVQEIISPSEPFQIGPFTVNPIDFPWDDITNQLLGMIQPALNRSGQMISQLATTTLKTLGNLLFIFIISIYFASELPRLGGYIGSFATQPGYRDDAERLMRDFGRIWGAYLRGQVILGFAIFLVVWVGLLILGVNNSLALGLLSGLLEFIPTLGPIIGAVVAIIVAIAQTSGNWGLTGVQLALAVFIFMIVVQQLENNLLVPRIVGGALDLHPLLILLAVFMGASLAGILGTVLAAPLAATLKLLGNYTWRKMFDLPPFPEAETNQMNDPPKSIGDRSRALLSRIKGK